MCVATIIRRGNSVPPTGLFLASRLENIMLSCCDCRFSCSAISQLEDLFLKKATE
jgi:hypothetical protein